MINKVSKMNLYQESDQRSYKELLFDIVGWNDLLRIYNTSDYFFTDTAIQLLGRGKIVVVDRLHAFGQSLSKVESNAASFF
jgi:hypothetical protein